MRAFHDATNGDDGSAGRMMIHYDRRELSCQYAELESHQGFGRDSADPAFSGEMTMVVTFEDRAGGTEVTILFEHIPSGIRPADNEAGTRSSLEKLARYVE